jgi:hypothetical protein
MFFRILIAFSLLIVLYEIPNPGFVGAFSPKRFFSGLDKFDQPATSLMTVARL